MHFVLLNHFGALVVNDHLSPRHAADRNRGIAARFATNAHILSVRMAGEIGMRVHDEVLWDEFEAGHQHVNRVVNSANALTAWIRIYASEEVSEPRANPAK